MAPSSRSSFEDFVEGLAQRGIEPGGRLVQQQHARPPQQRLGQTQTLAHALGIGPDPAIGGIHQADAVEQRPCRGGLDLLQPRVECQRFAPGQGGIERDILRQIAEQPARREFARRRILVQHADRAAVGVDESEHQLDQRGLAGAVMADQRAQPPRDEVERDVAQRAAPRRSSSRRRSTETVTVICRLRLADGFGGGAIKGWVSTTPPG